MTTHVLLDLPEYPLQLLDRERAKQVDEHLRDRRSCLQKLGVINDCMFEVIMEPIDAWSVACQRSRILQDVNDIAPFSIYHSEMARILNVPIDELVDYMRLIPPPSTWVHGPIPQCRLFPYNDSPDSPDAIRTLVIMESGSHFSMHEHYGDEVVLILQGSMLNQDGKIYRPGDVLFMAAGTSHAFDVPEGLALIYLVVVDKGLRIGDLQVLPPVLL